MTMGRVTSHCRPSRGPALARGLLAPASVLALLVALLVALLLAGAVTAVAANDDWPLVGTQGVVRVVIVPADQASDAEAYQRQIDRLCPPGETCFVNFHTNSTGATAALPLPDAIAREVTARFRRSAKVGREIFEWSCRLKVEDAPCF